MWKFRYSVGGPLVWNSLPAAVREADSLHSSRRKLKTHQFTLCFIDYLFLQPPLTYLRTFMSAVKTPLGLRGRFSPLTFYPLLNVLDQMKHCTAPPKLRGLFRPWLAQVPPPPRRVRTHNSALDPVQSHE